MPDRRRITIRRQSGGGLCSFRGHPVPGGHRRASCVRTPQRNRDHPDYGGEVNHAALIDRLVAYDGWALSTLAEALPVVLALCPPGVRVAAWHRGERPTRSRWPLHAWEPVLYHGGRQLAIGPRRADSLVCGVAPLDTLPGRVIGAKPAAVCRWTSSSASLKSGRSAVRPCP